MKRFTGLMLFAVALAGCGAAEEPKESAAESAHEAQVQSQEQVAEKHCEARGEVLAQGSDEQTQCVSNEQKQHEIESGEKSGPHYEAEQQANENEEEKRKDEEAEKIEHERSSE